VCIRKSIKTYFYFQNNQTQQHSVESPSLRFFISIEPRKKQKKVYSFRNTADLEQVTLGHSTTKIRDGVMWNNDCLMDLSDKTL
jgi:hypothetical protein